MFERPAIRRLSKSLVMGLSAAGKKIVLAESCTGGMLSSFLTDVPGSSAVLWGGLVVYSNQAKEELAGVDPALIAAHGAVSRECVEALLEGALRASGADIAAAVSGIAGPGGGSAEKPVGTVWLGIASSEGKKEIIRKGFSGSRQAVRLSSCLQLLHMLSREFLSSPTRANP